MTIGDPVPDALFDFAVYARGAMTLHHLRLQVGDDDFFTILRQWSRSQAGGNVTTDEFIALAERISGQELDELFRIWLFTPEKPLLADATVTARVAVSATIDVCHAPPAARSLLQRFGRA